MCLKNIFGLCFVKREPGKEKQVIKNLYNRNDTK